MSVASVPVFSPEGRNVYRSSTPITSSLQRRDIRFAGQHIALLWSENFLAGRLSYKHLATLWPGFVELGSYSAAEIKVIEACYRECEASWRGARYFCVDG